MIKIFFQNISNFLLNKNYNSCHNLKLFLIFKLYYLQLSLKFERVSPTLRKDLELLLIDQL